MTGDRTAVRRHPALPLPHDTAAPLPARFAMLALIPAPLHALPVTVPAIPERHYLPPPFGSFPPPLPPRLGIAPPPLPAPPCIGPPGLTPPP